MANMEWAVFSDAAPATAAPATAAPANYEEAPALSATKKPRITVKRVALACLGTGALLMAFVAYQLWGTALYEHHAQSLLLGELKTKGIVPGRVHQEASAPSTTQKPGGAPTDQVAPTMSQPAVGQPIGVISIPAIGVNGDAIVQGTDEAQLQEGPGHYTGTPLPGEAGNAAIAGHRTTYAAPFYNLNGLQPGNLIYIQTSQGSFVYQVTRSEIVSPNNVSVLDSTSSLPELTLTTCNPRYSAAERLVVIATLSSSSVLTSAPSPATPQSHDAPSQRSSRTSGALSRSTTLGEVGQGVLWGTLTLAIAISTIFVWRRLQGLRAAAVLVVGAPASIAALLVCFQHVSLALPQTF